MQQELETIEMVELPQPRRDLGLLVVPDAWTYNFLENLRELFSAGEHMPIEGDGAVFWPDVFVRRGLPWRRFLQSGAYHVAAIFMIWAGSRFVHLQSAVTEQPAFAHADVVFYAPSDYLPPIDTRRANPAASKRAEPEHSKQTIISVPPEARNHQQTVVAPLSVKLHRNVALPNVVAWSEKPLLPIAPAPVVLASETSRLAPKIDQAVVAPPPEVADHVQPSKEKPLAPQLSVIAPPPEVDAQSSRRIGDLDIGRSTVIAPAPQLSMQEQRANRTGARLSAQSVRVIAPPPSVRTDGGSRSRGNMIALNLRPSVKAPPEAIAGNRRGSFATTPEGHRGSTGAVGTDGKRGKADATTSAKQSGSDLPAGLYIGKGAEAPPVNPNLLADARPPRVSARTLRTESANNLSEEERAVFGSRKFYSLSLNMPNLNSAGGSWIIRFAALNSSGAVDSYGRAGGSGDAAASSNDGLSAPSATRKVDPAYPLELMRQNVGGTVILYGVIRSDGTVGNIRVLRSADERLDHYASQAIANWQFEPARKLGSPVDVEATFWIPFRPAKTSSGF